MNYNDPNNFWKLDAENDILTLNNLLGKGLIGEYCFLYLLRQLPFFKMCAEFEASLYKYLLNAKGELPPNGYGEDPFALACYDVREQAAELGLTPQFWTKEELDKMRREELIWKIKNTCLTVKVRGNTVKASIWYQLAAKFFMEHSVFEEYLIINEHPGFKMLPCFYSNWDSLIEGRFGSKPKPRKNVKNPWPDGVDFGSLHSEYGDCFTQYFIDNFH